MLRTCICIAIVILSLQVTAQQKKPIPVIFDSDMGPDYDDVGAITMLHAFADSGYAKIVATVASTNYEGVAGVFNVFNTYFNRPDILIGVPKEWALGLKDWQHWTDTLLKNYPHRITRNSEVPGAVEVYRKVLAQQPDKSVTIITTGFLTNLANLLRSGADKYSKLTGDELVRRKVKQVVCMGGRFPSGKEFNLHRDSIASQYVATHWKTAFIFSGFEIGHPIRTGLPLIRNAAIINSPVKEVFRMCIPMDAQDSLGRMSWDETAVLVAIKGVQPYYTLETGRIIMNEDGSNSWQKAAGPHARLLVNLPPAQIEKLLNTLIMHQPVKK